MKLPVLVLPPGARLPAALLQILARGSLVLLSLYHVPLLLPELHQALDYRPLSTLELGALLAVFFALPELGAGIVRWLCASRAWIESGTLVIEGRAGRTELPVGEIAETVPWALPVPWPGLRLRPRSGVHSSLRLAAADPSGLLELLGASGAATPAREALAHPSLRLARARARARSRFDRPLLKFVVFALVPALPLFRLHQWISFGGTFGEYHEFGLAAYLLGFGVYWLLSAIYLLLFAAGLRALAESLTLVALLLPPRWDLAVRRVAEGLLRALYYLTPPALLIARLALQ